MSCLRTYTPHTYPGRRGPSVLLLAGQDTQGSSDVSRIVSCRMTSWHSRSPRTYMGQSRATVASQRSGHAVEKLSAPWIKTTDTQSKTTPEHPQHPNDIHSAAALAHRRSILLIRPSPSPRNVDYQLQCCSPLLDRYSIYATGLSRKSSLHL